MHFPMYSVPPPDPYPSAMESPHNKVLFDGMYEVRIRLLRAVDRCKDISLSEHTMGYPASAQAYSDLAAELAVTRVWIDEYMKSLIEIA
jgi:hypothetical protein